MTGVIAHGQDLKFCFVDLLKWPADANTTVNVILTVLKFIKEKVWTIIGHIRVDLGWDTLFPSAKRLIKHNIKL